MEKCSLFSWFYLVACVLLRVTELLWDDYFELFVRQFTDLYLPGAGYWSFISLLQWFHVCLIFNDLCSLELASAFRGTNTSFNFYRQVSAAKDLQLGLQTDEIASRTTVKLGWGQVTRLLLGLHWNLWFVDPITRHLGRRGSCVVSWWIGLPLSSWSVGLMLGQVCY